MNYLIAFSVCMLLTIIEASDENYRTLLLSDSNVAVFLALAWALERQTK